MGVGRPKSFSVSRKAQKFARVGVLSVWEGGGMEWEGTKSAVGEGGIPDFGDHFLIIYVICVSCLLHSTRHLL